MPCCTPSQPNPSTTVDAAKAHMHLHTRDLAASVAFYRSLFGADPVKLKPGYAKFLPAWAPVNLALSQSDSHEPGDAVSHLGIQVASKDELQSQLRRVRSEGLAVRVEMDVDCCHANQDKFWVRDPSGVEWEVYHLNHDLAEDDARSASACCTR